jgi:similar to spore coat protein
MNALLESVMGMDKLSDQVIATDYLISVKSGMRNLAMAITEATSPEVKTVLRAQLNDTIAAHENITNYMMRNGYYHAYDMKEQFKLDMKTTETALKLAKSLM